MWNDPVTRRLYPEMNVHICTVHLSRGRHYLGGWSERASCSRGGRTKEAFSHICAHEYLDFSMIMPRHEKTRVGPAANYKFCKTKI